MTAVGKSIPQPDIPDSLWRATATPLDPQPSLDGRRETDVAIVGAGFTGCSAALHLALSGTNCIVLDAGQPGIGASGRNGGQVNPGIKKPLHEVQDIWGKDEGEELYRIIGTAPDLVFELVTRFKISCHPVRTGIIQPAYSSSSMKYLEDYGKTQASLGAPVELLDREATHRMVGSEFYRGGFLDKRAGSVQPLSYCRGLAHAALDSGAEFFGDSPVTEMHRQDGKWLVITPGGSVSAESVLVCTNGYTDLVPHTPLIRELSKTVIPFYSYKVATAPLDPELADTIIPGNQVVAEPEHNDEE